MSVRNQGRMFLGFLVVFLWLQAFPEGWNDRTAGEVSGRIFGSLSYLVMMIPVDFRTSEMAWNHQPVSQKQLDPQNCLSSTGSLARPGSSMYGFTRKYWLMSLTISITVPYKMNICPIFSHAHLSLRGLTCLLSLRLSRCGQRLRHVETQIKLSCLSS